MNDNKTFRSVTEMVAAVSDDDSLRHDVRQRIEQRRLVKALHAIRTAKGVSQASIGEQLNCSQSRVSKIENGLDRDLRVGELEGYARAIDCDVNLQFTKRNETAFERIQRLAFSIHRELCNLAKLAHTDEVIAKGVANTFGEVLFNQLNLLRLAADALPNDPETDEPYIKINLEIEEDAQCDSSRPTLISADSGDLMADRSPAVC